MSTIRPDPRSQSVFRASLEQGECVLTFQLAGTRIRGRALIDTGSTHTLLDLRFAEAAGIAADHARSVEVWRTGDRAETRPTAEVDLELVADEGPPVRLRARLPLEGLAPGHDLLLGTDLLLRGLFTLHGPRGIWTWQVAPERV